ncbi:MAG: hypothetical protein FWE52_01700 [Alphaproteobacteria bacterium]|nr:hypothetical protein [Alphaproteobacteria bacterium]
MSKANTFKTLAAAALVAFVPGKVKSQNKQDTNHRPLVESIAINFGFGSSNSTNVNFDREIAFEKMPFDASRVSGLYALNKRPSVMVADVTIGLRNRNPRFSTKIAPWVSHSIAQRNVTNNDRTYFTEVRNLSETTLSFGIGIAQEYRLGFANASIEAIARGGIALLNQKDDYKLCHNKYQGQPAFVYTKSCVNENKDAMNYMVGLATNLPIIDPLHLRIEAGATGNTFKKPGAYVLVGAGFKFNTGR